MDQTEIQRLINEIQEQARDAVHEWAEGKNLCPSCVESRVQSFAESVITGALAYAADEHAVEYQVDETMALYDEIDAKQAAKDGAK